MRHEPGRSPGVPLVALCLAIAVVVALLPVVAQAQPDGRGGQRGGQRGNIAAMMYLEFTWAAVNFGCEATPEQIAELRPVYQDVSKRRREARAEAMKTQDFQAIQAHIDETNKELGAALIKELSEAQIALLTQWQETLTKLNELLQSQPAQPGQQPGARRGGGMAAMYLERSWAALSFGVDVTDEQLATLTPVYKDAFQARKDAVTAGNADLCTAVLDDTRANVDAKAKAALTEEQMTKYTALTTFGRPGGQGGGQGGGRPGGGGGGRPRGGPGGPPAQ